MSSLSKAITYLRTRRNTSYPIHPIDATWISNITDDGVPICEGTFGYTPDDAGLGELSNV